MEQPLASGTLGGLLSGSATNYTPIGYMGSVGTTELHFSTYIPTDGTLTNLYCRLDASPGTGNSYALTVRKNGATPASSLTCTISGSDTVGTDLVNSVSVSKGDYVCLMSVPSSTPTGRRLAFSCTFTSDTANEAICMAHTSDVPSSSSNEYIGFACGDTWSTDSSKMMNPMPSANTAKKIYAVIDVAPDTGKSWTLSLTNYSTAKAVTCTISNLETQADDAVNTEALSAGTEYGYKSVPASTPDAYAHCWLSIVFSPDTDGESYHFYASDDSPHATNTEYDCAGTGASWGTWKGGRTHCFEQTYTVKNLYVQLETAPSAGKSRVFTLEDNLVDSSIVATISDTDVSDDDTANTFESAAGELTMMQTVPSGSPSSTYGVRFSYVTYKEVAAESRRVMMVT